MESVAQQKAWIAKIVGSCYFILLGFVYTVMELVSARFSFGDLGVLLWACLPILINKRWMYLCFGAVNLLLWLYIALAAISTALGDAISLAVISAAAIGAIVSAILLIYSALNIPEKRFSLI